MRSDILLRGSNPDGSDPTDQSVKSGGSDMENSNEATDSVNHHSNPLYRHPLFDHTELHNPFLTSSISSMSSRASSSSSSEPSSSSSSSLMSCSSPRSANCSPTPTTTIATAITLPTTTTTQTVQIIKQTSASNSPNNKYQSQLNHHNTTPSPDTISFEQMIKPYLRLASSTTTMTAANMKSTNEVNSENQINEDNDDDDDDESEEHECNNEENDNSFDNEDIDDNDDNMIAHDLSVKKKPLKNENKTNVKLNANSEPLRTFVANESRMVNKGKSMTGKVRRQMANSNDKQKTMPSGIINDNSQHGSSHHSKRGVLPKQATSIMRSWLFQHIVVRIDLLFM